MTNLSKEQHDAQIDDMRSFDEQMPSVGIFLYDPADNTLLDLAHGWSGDMPGSR